MERFNRWVAGYRMIQDRPLLGFGPGTFYENYKPYLETPFLTYVSNNPEKSGIHNYYLMTTVEQGIFGGLLFLLLCIVSLFYGVDVYRKLERGYEKDLVITSVLVLLIICAILIINDMVEAARVGPFFFLSLFIITKFGLKANNRVRGAKK